MNNELQQKLFSEFPLLFRQKDLPKTETAMCWGICTGDGWYDLLYNLCKEIEAYYSQFEFNDSVTVIPLDEWNRMSKEERENGATKYLPRIEFTQVKQKFGSLTIYYSPSLKDDYIRGLLAMIRRLSTTTCESCGAKGNLIKTGWVKCLCEKCEGDVSRWSKYHKP